MASKAPVSPTKSPTPAAATGGRGSMGGGLNASAVDTDKLWRDRIRQELQFQRQWKEEFGFLQTPSSTARGTARNTTNNTTNEPLQLPSIGNKNSNNNNSNNTAGSVSARGTAGTTVLADIGSFTPRDLVVLQKQLQNAQYTSTVQASYKYDRSRLLELGAGTHRRQKFRV